MGGNYREVAAALNKLSADIVLCAEVHQNNVKLWIFGCKAFLLTDCCAFDRVVDNIIFDLLKLGVGHLRRILDFAVEHAVFAHDPCERAGIKSVDSRDTRIF